MVSAGNTKRRRKYMMKGKESAVPPHMAMDIMVEKPLVRSNPSIVSLPASSSI